MEYSCRRVIIACILFIVVYEYVNIYPSVYFGMYILGVTRFINLHVCVKMRYSLCVCVICNKNIYCMKIVNDTNF